MKKNDDNIEKLFDKEFDEFISGEINESYSPDEETKNRIKERVMKDIEQIKAEENRKDIAVISDIREEKMKRRGNRKFKKIAAMVASLAIVVGIGTGITIGKDFMTTTKTVKSGRLLVEEEHLDIDPSEIRITLPKELKGKVFDKNGNEVTVLKGSMRDLFDENGNRIERLPIDGEGNYKPETPETVEYKNFTDAKEAAKHANFTLRVLPGMNIDKIEFTKDENGKIDGDYATIYQSKDGQQVIISERNGSDDLSYESGGDKVEQVKVLGKDAILWNSSNLDLDNGDSYIGINAKLSDYKGAELVKLATTLVEVNK